MSALLTENIEIMNQNIIFREPLQRIVLYYALLLSVTGCDIKKSKSDPSDSFSAVYDHPDMNLSFYPVDMVQTSDGGFLVLSVYTDTASKYLSADPSDEDRQIGIPGPRKGGGSCLLQCRSVH